MLKISHPLPASINNRPRPLTVSFYPALLQFGTMATILGVGPHTPVALSGGRFARHVKKLFFDSSRAEDISLTEVSEPCRMEDSRFSGVGRLGRV